MTRAGVLILCALFGAGCGGGGGDGIIDAAEAPDAYHGPSAALFEVPRGAAPPSGFYALPYPNDIRVDDGDGHIDLTDHPRPNQIIGEYVDIVGERQRGFSVSAALFARFTHPIDAGSLPADPAASLDDDASVYLVNVDPDSAARGQRIPLRFRFEHFAGEAIGTDWLSALPFPGFPMDRATTYALVLTSRLRAPDGSAVAVADDFAAIAGDGSVDAQLERARAIYAPLWSWLDEAGGDERADVISAAVFTTQDPTSLMGLVRQVVFEEFPAPRARGLKFIRAVDGFRQYEGTYEAPNFQTGNVPYSRIDDGGEIVVDAETGRPVVQRTEELRFSFAVPAGDMPAGGWPMVLYSHGTGGSYRSYLSHAKVLAERGLAVIGIDQVLHGPRNPNASPEISFFNFQNPLAARFNTLQGALDNYQLLRLVLGFDYTERHPGGRTIRFDPDKIYFMGHSQGGLTGPPFLAHEPLVKGAVLSGAGGLLYLSMLYKTQPLDVASIVAAFIRDYPLDEFNPILALLQGWIDISDTVAYAPHLVRDPLPGVGAKHIFQTEGFIDRFTPPPSIEALAVAIGCSPVSPVLQEIEGLGLRGADVLTPPFSGNLEGMTAALLQYDEVSDSDGHFVVYDVPAAIKQYADFLATMAEDGVPTIVAP
jgi:alpha-beta hydrolase superfamily lysophospholipase